MTPLSVRFALRELRSGVRGFRIFLACLALGVAAIAAASSTAEAFRQGLASQAREILGGDVSVILRQRGFTDPERKRLAALGQVSYSVATRAMAEAGSGERRLVELRGVSGDYPLAGEVKLAGATGLRQALSVQNGRAGAAVEQALLDRLGLRVGDPFVVGNLPLRVGAVLLEEPDRLSRGFALGPRVLTSREAVEQGGFLSPGLPYGETARIALRSGVTLDEARRAATQGMNGAFRFRDREDAAPGARRMIDQLEYFLGLIGLASLVAGGLGVFGAVSAYLDQRRPSIAILKAIGADGALVRNLYLVQIGVLAALGIAIGLAVGGAAPLVLGAYVQDRLPIPALFRLYPEPLMRAAAFGALSAAAFALAPLGRARKTPPSSLFRSDLKGRLGLGPESLAALAAGAGLAGLAVATAPSTVSAGALIGGVAGAFLLLWLLGWSAAAVAGRARRLARGPVRVGLANLAGPRSAARTAAPAIGLGVGLLAAVVLIQSSLLRQVSEIAPQSAPALVFTEIPGGRAAEFDAAVARSFGEPLSPDRYMRAPLVTGRIAAINARPIVQAAIAPEHRWAYDADVSMSAIGPEPAGAAIKSGRWWPADYAGPPLLAMDEDVAAAGGVRIGDTLTLSVLGRDVEAKVAVLRDVEFGAFGPSFPLILNPSVFEGAQLRQVAIAKAGRAQESAVIRALGETFPEVDVISVREQLEAAAELFDRLALAVRGAAAVACLAGVLVLAGAIAARARERAREAATLKVLGASRAQILAAYMVEYGAVGLLAGLAGVAIGYAAAWPVVVKVFRAEWSVDWAGLASLLAGAAVAAALGGLAAAFHALARRPAEALRSG
jgi:putative ABC transport system permease protein